MKKSTVLFAIIILVAAMGIGMLVGQKNTLKIENANLNEKIAELTKTQESGQAEAQKSLTETQTQLNAANEQLTLANAEISRLKGENETLTAKVKEFNTQHSRANSVTIFHTNDVFSHVKGNETDEIGYAKLATLVNEERKAGPTLVLDAGNALHGTTYASLTGGMSVVSLMNKIGYDAMTPGNHDFNYGVDHLKELEAGMNFPLVNATVYHAGAENVFKPYILKEIAGKTIAIVGVGTPQMVSTIHPDLIKGYSFEGEQILQPIIDEAAEKSDAVILLAHWGYGDPMPDSSVLAAMPHVDLVIDGHSCNTYEEITQQAGSALIVSAGSYMNRIGKVELVFNADGTLTCTETPITPEEAKAIVPDAEVAAEIEKTTAEQNELLGNTIGQTKVQLDGGRNAGWDKETNFGDFLTDSIREHAQAEFAFVTGSALYVPIREGDITKRDVLEALPYNNHVVVLEVSGETLLQAMENGLKSYPNKFGGFPQISGGTITFDPALEAGQRIVSFQINNQEIERDRLYTVATSDYLMRGGDGYTVLTECKVLQELSLLDEVLATVLGREQVISPEVGTRLTVGTALQK